jgi:hypothetical protein
VSASSRGELGAAALSIPPGTGGTAVITTLIESIR